MDYFELAQTTETYGDIARAILAQLGVQAEGLCQTARQAIHELTDPLPVLRLTEEQLQDRMGERIPVAATEPGIMAEVGHQALAGRSAGEIRLRAPGVPQANAALAVGYFTGPFRAAEAALLQHHPALAGVVPAGDYALIVAMTMILGDVYTRGVTLRPAIGGNGWGISLRQAVDIARQGYAVWQYNCRTAYAWQSDEPQVWLRDFENPAYHHPIARSDILRVFPVQGVRVGKAQAA